MPKPSPPFTMDERPTMENPMNDENLRAELAEIRRVADRALAEAMIASGLGLHLMQVMLDKAIIGRDDAAYILTENAHLLVAASEEGPKEEQTASALAVAILRTLVSGYTVDQPPPAGKERAPRRRSRRKPATES